jgi:hypothetical protein
MGMKLSTRTILWLIVGFIWCWFMGITAVSLGLGSLFPDINRVAQPFVCPGGQMEINSQNYQVSPVEDVTTLTWYCVDDHSGAKTELNPFIINIYAGSFYGLLIIVAALISLYFYGRWGSANETEAVKKRVVWIQGACVLVIIVGATLINLIPLIHSLTPKPTTVPDATATALASTYEALTSKTTSDFNATDKPLADWNGIPIMPEAIAGQEIHNGAYSFKIPVDSGTIETYYKDKLKSMGWNLADSRWQGMQFIKDKRVLLVTLVPAADMESWIVTLVSVP